jgi:hypothetical protein
LAHDRRGPLSGHALRVLVLPGELAVARLDAGAPLPGWASPGDDPLHAVVHTTAETSIVCAAARVPDGVRAEHGWRALAVEGRLDFALTGVLAALAVPLADAGVSIFAVSTYDTDHVLVRCDRLGDAVEALRAAGHQVARPS